MADSNSFWNLLAATAAKSQWVLAEIKGQTLEGLCSVQEDYSVQQ